MRTKQPKANYEFLTKEKARLIAHLIGDGAHYKCQSDYNIKYEVTDQELLDSFKSDLVYVYGLNPFEGTNPSGKTGRLIPYVRLRSKMVFEDLLRYADYFSKDWQIKSPLLNAEQEIIIEFLRALFDDEGSVIPQGKKAIVRLYSINAKGLEQVRNLVKKLGIESKIVPGFGARRNVYALTIKEIKGFDQKIGFNLSRKINKLRSYL